ncbi:MAG: hypothetical protein PHF86_10765, partial [Candidatus Nanoarchaeia archaeon]|nr:hypothetical protein [Candidatus Nanoarchaeia archaeon]
MTIYNLKKSIERLQESLSKFDDKNLKSTDLRKSFFNFQERKQSYLQDSINSSMNVIKTSLVDLNEILKTRPTEKLKVQELINNIDSLYTKKEFSKLKEPLNYLHEIVSSINVPQKELTFKKPKNIPEEIKSEIFADIQEIEKCFKFGCYRSSVIVCGRLLETALHRKYFELTNNDLLEKAPGIGLG